MNRATSKYFKVGATAKIDEKCFGKLFIYFFSINFFLPNILQSILCVLPKISLYSFDLHVIN